MTAAPPQEPQAPPAPPPPAPAPPEPRRRVRPPARLLALMAAVVLVLSGNAAALLLVDRSGDEVAAGGDPVPATVADPSSTSSVPELTPSTTVVPDPTTTTTTAPSTPLERTVAELSVFVADQRELEFLRPVEVELLGDEAFVERLLDGAEENRQEVDESERVLRALRLLEPGVDLFESFTSFFGDAVLGFYDPETDELVLRGAELTPYVRGTLVHELSHGLDDQHFELDRPEIDEADDESALAFSSLIEGVAIAIETAYSATLSADEQEQADAEAAEFAGRGAMTAIPPIVVSLVQFPYLAGPTFISALLDDGGEARIDEAFRDPPTTSEQILEPSIYLRGEQPQQVAPPPAGGPVIDEGSFGQWALYLTLNELIDGDIASRAAEGWGGDSYVAWDEGDRTCVRMAFAMDSPSDLAELDGAWRAWAESHGDTTVETSAGVVTVTACG